MISRFLGEVRVSAMTVLSMSTVMHRGQNRAPSRRGAPQDGQVFMPYYPNVSKPYWNSMALISATVRRWHKPYSTMLSNGSFTYSGE